MEMFIMDFGRMTSNKVQENSFFRTNSHTKEISIKEPNQVSVDMSGTQETSTMGGLSETKEKD